MLGISDKRVYEYVDAGRLSSVWATDVIMIPLDAVKSFIGKMSCRLATRGRRVRCKPRSHVITCLADTQRETFSPAVLPSPGSLQTAIAVSPS